MRRKFYEAKDQKPKLTGWFLRQIQNLYHIESQLRQRRVGPAERERVRISQSLPLYRRLGKALLKIRTKRKILPQSNLGKAIDYAMGQWSKLQRCFKDGRLEIDNNLTENGIRPTKLGAKNCRHSVMAARDAAASSSGCSSIAARSGERWLFMGSESAGQTNAIWYTLIESCRRRRLDPWKYLVWIFEELPKVKVTADTFASYTPKAYAKTLSQPRLKKTA